MWCSIGLKQGASWYLASFINACCQKDTVSTRKSPGITRDELSNCAGAGGPVRTVDSKLKVVDAVIAATALENGLALLTRNVKDFAGLGVVLLNPWDEA